MTRLNILAIDDNPTNLRLVSDIFEYEGWQVYRAEDAENALEIIDSKSIDVVLMDIALPGMDGLTLTRKLKQNSATRHITIIAVTAFAMKGDKELALNAGCDAYISKPIDTRHIVSEVEGIHLMATSEQDTTQHVEDGTSGDDAN